MSETANPLFAAADLRTPLGREVSEADAAHAERIVWGWLRPLLATESRPAPIPAEVWSWAVELGAIYLENPTGLSVYQMSAERLQFSSERRGQILADVEKAMARKISDGSTGGPYGSFPPPRDYPEPAGGPRCRW